MIELIFESDLRSNKTAQFLFTRKEIEKNQWQLLSIFLKQYEYEYRSVKEFYHGDFIIVTYPRIDRDTRLAMMQLPFYDNIILCIKKSEFKLKPLLQLLGYRV